MKLKDLLDTARQQLKEAGIATARLDAIILLEQELGKDRAWILAHLDEPISKLSKKFAQSLQRRLRHEPIAYIIGKCEFYGRTFLVNSRTLVPRPETETMIDLAKKYVKNEHIIDVGCGSGAIGITAKLENIGTELTMVDIDKECVEISRKNAKDHGVTARILVGSLLEPIKNSQNPWVIMANLPYVPDSHTINQAAMFEPKHAIFGGSDGLDLYRQMFEQIKGIEIKPALILMESLPPQHKSLSEIARIAGYHQLARRDFIQVFAR